MNEINEFALKAIQNKFPNMNIAKRDDEAGVQGEEQQGETPVGEA